MQLEIQEEEKGLKVALRLLARRDYFAKELKEKLSAKGLSVAVVEKTLATCKKRGYIDDALHLDRIVASEVRKGRGPRYIALKLRRKSGMSSIPIAMDEETSIRALLPKLSKKYDVKIPTGKQKLFQALQRRGFETEAILAILDQDPISKFQNY
jgi:regulatory protein